MPHKPPKSRAIPTISPRIYKQTLYQLQIELVKLQKEVIEQNKRILILLEGRDSGGKDGMIKRITAHLSPRETRVVALNKPSDRESSQWYFQRYVEHLPAAQEIVLFNRSWYNRAGVEKVMGFCTPNEYESFMHTVPDFETMLIRDGILFFKYYLDISRSEQKKRLKARRTDPLKQWKMSPIDAQAQERWDAYSQARNQMLVRTHTALSPWFIVRADDKKMARISLIQHLLSQLDYKKKNADQTLFDPQIVFEFEEAYLNNGLIAP